MPCSNSPSIHLPLHLPIFPCYSTSVFSYLFCSSAVKQDDVLASARCPTWCLLSLSLLLVVLLFFNLPILLSPSSHVSTLLSMLPAPISHCFLVFLSLYLLFAHLFSQAGRSCISMGSMDQSMPLSLSLLCFQHTYLASSSSPHFLTPFFLLCIVLSSRKMMY